jgi:hypothetical protein
MKMGLFGWLFGKRKRGQDFSRQVACREIDAKGQTLIIEVVRDRLGNVVGVWCSTTDVANDVGRLKVKMIMALGECITAEQRKKLMLENPRIVPNTYDDTRGCFVMLSAHEAPGEKAYVCDVCGQHFDLTQLDKHYAKTAQQAIQILRARASEGTGISNVAWGGAMNTIDDTGKAWCPRCVPSASAMPGPGHTVHRAG